MSDGAFPSRVATFLTVAATIALLVVRPLIGADSLTQHYNNARTGAVLDETKLNTSTVNSGRFGKLWTLYADGQVVAQPLYVSGLAVNTAGNGETPLVQGTFNAVIVATMHNTVFVYDADRERRGPDGRTVPLWAKWLGPPRAGGKDIDMWSTNDPEWGIVATPVVSPDKRTLFVVAWHSDGPQGLRYMLHALDLQKGVDRLPAVTIGASANSTPNPCVAQNTYNPCVQKQRSALLLAGGVLYVGFGGDGNRGALFAFDAATLTERAFWTSTPTGTDGGIWQSGQGPAADAQGNVYLMTGNGTFDANTNGSNYGNSVVKLKLTGATLAVKDYFTPCNFAFLNSRDLDLGSGGPVLLPVTPPRIIGGGKEGVLYVLAADNLGKHAAPGAAPDCQNANIVQQVRAFGVTVHADGQEHHGNIHGSPVFWNAADGARIYAWGENNRLKAYRFSQGRLQDVANPKMSAFQPPQGMPGGMLALSANGGTAGSGILWAVVPLDGDANQQRGVNGIVLAFDAQDVSRTLWTSEQNSQRDRLGLFAKFNPPVIAAGKVFVPTYGDTEPRRTYGGNSRPTVFPKYYVAVYGLLPAAVAPAVVDQARDDVTVLRAATSPLNLNTTQCTAIDDTSVDCTAALVQATGGAPAFHRVVLATGQDVAGCAVVRVTTASKDTGLAAASGIGFWSSQAADGNLAAEDSGRFVPSAALRAVGSATLRNGAAATLHEFVGVTNCPLGGGSAMARLFKPYMQFEGTPDGRTFRNWDLADNYRISRIITTFDRSAEVLR